jgi:hypothetical protein
MGRDPLRPVLGRLGHRMAGSATAMPTDKCACRARRRPIPARAVTSLSRHVTQEQIAFVLRPA